MHTLDEELRWRANITPEQKRAVDDIVRAIVEKVNGDRQLLVRYAEGIAVGFGAIQVIEQEGVSHQRIVEFVERRLAEANMFPPATTAPGYAFQLDVLRPVTQCSRDIPDLFEVLRWVLFRLTEEITSPYAPVRAPAAV